MPKSVNPLKRRNTSSPLSTSPQKKKKLVSRQSSGSSSLAHKDDVGHRLDDVGLIPTLAPPDVPQDVVRLMRYILASAYEEVPDRAAGMNSERISEVLRFRQGLPPIVSIAHLHALSASTTDTERELARLVTQGVVRKVTIPGRGKKGSAVGDGVVLVEEWKGRLRRETGIAEEVKEAYTSLMDAQPAKATTSMTTLTDPGIRALVTAGFLTNPAALSSSIEDRFARPGMFSPGSIATVGSTAATGTLAAVGGQGAIHDSGGGGSTLATKDTRPSLLNPQLEMTFSLPSTGMYLKLLTEARLHLLYLLKQLSPRYKEATRDMLEEKWNGNVANDAASRAKRLRGEWTGILPGKTKRWRDFYGLHFEWVLAECVGGGLVELFDTGSVGIGVRGT